MKISILGCGWLGLPLAEHLISKHHFVKGSTTSEQKIELLSKAGIEPFLIALGANEPAEKMATFLSEAEVLIIAIPPGLRKDPTADFVSKIQTLIPFIEKSGVNKILLISSIGVFEDNNQRINKFTQPNGNSESAKQMIAVEKLLQNNQRFQTTVLRFGGLINETRHPILILSGKKNLPHPKAPVNLIHLEDCIGIVEAIIEQNYWGKSLNAVGEEHPTRASYYTEMAKINQLPLPTFNEKSVSVGKNFKQQLLEKEIGYQFKKPIAPFKIKI